MTKRGRRRAFRWMLGSCILLILASRASAAAVPDLTGLWAAKLRFGPDVRGALTIARSGGAWTAEIAGRSTAVAVDGEWLSFELADGQGGFRGRLLPSGRIEGHWIQPQTVTQGSRYATPVALEPLKDDRWRGEVEPLADAFTWFLSIRRGPNDTLSAWLGNPERNIGYVTRADRIVLDGRTVRLLARSGRDAPPRVIGEGRYSEEDTTFSLALRGGTCDFRRATLADEALFFPRPRSAGRWTYRRPTAEDDGWPVASPDEAGLSRETLTSFVRMLIDTPMDSVRAVQLHAVLIARDGRLVLEEYFHGFHRESLHDTRSAAKSFCSFLIGAAIERGVPISASTRVYEAMESPAVFAKLEPRKRALTLAHLLTMSSGLDMDDSDPRSAGNEETMTQEQRTQPDWYRYTLDLKTVRDPGVKAVYGSASPNLAGGVLAKVSRRWLPELFQELVAEPLRIRRYAMNLQPNGEAYMGGGTQVTARDFLKFGQVLADSGRWRGRQILSPAWAAKSSERQFDMGRNGYGYLWWTTDLPYRGRTVRAFYAGGNGGQVAMAIPELRLAVAFFGGNYNDVPTLFTSQRVYLPDYILPAVK